MNKKSTLNLKLQNSIIAQALRSEKMPKPTETSLAFIKNFAYNFRVQQCGDGIVHDFVLN
ncbi:MAG: hypothetical protein E7087_05460 [Bacteroidales bacterium]|nr:hypothetical protein [Bacteroidales bacterium]